MSLNRPPVCKAGEVEIDLSNIKRPVKTLPSRYWMRFQDRDWEHMDPTEGT